MNKLLLFFFSLLLLAGLFAPLMAPHDAQFYFERGTDTLNTTDPDRQWTYRWDLNSARADFSHAIRLNPNFTAAYTNRANVECLRGEFDAAFEDYTRAIGLNPRDPNPYVQRAGVAVAKRDFAGALLDYEQAIDLQPDYRLAYRGRIQVKEMQNDYSGAAMERVRMIETMGPAYNDPNPGNGGWSTYNANRWSDRLLRQLDRALETDTNFAWGYYYRGVIESLTNDWGNALADFRHCQSFSDGRVKDYAAIHTWLAQTQAGDRKKADQELLAYCQNRTNGKSTDWEMQIARFLLNQVSEADFLRAIDASGTEKEQSEFWYYTGMTHLLAGDKTGANDRFQKSLTTRTRPCAVFFSAGAELSALNPPPPAE